MKKGRKHDAGFKAKVALSALREEETIPELSKLSPPEFEGPSITGITGTQGPTR